MLVFNCKLPHIGAILTYTLALKQAVDFLNGLC